VEQGVAGKQRFGAARRATIGQGSEKFGRPRALEFLRGVHAFNRTHGRAREMDRSLQCRGHFRTAHAAPRL